MSEVRYIEHSGVQILLMDFSDEGDTLSVTGTAEEAMRIVRDTGEPHSIRGLLDFSGRHLNKGMRDSMKRMSKNNGPYMKAIAFVGLGRALSPIFSGLLLVTKRSNHRVFKTRPEALEWLSRR